MFKKRSNVFTDSKKSKSPTTIRVVLLIELNNKLKTSKTNLLLKKNYLLSR
jgi:hypothetical protein